MKAEFNLSGTTFRIGGDRIGGTSQNGSECCGAVPEGQIAFQVFQQPLDGAGPAEGFYLLGVTLKPSEARAVASMLLSAATEAKR